MKDALLTHGSLFSGIGGFDLAAEWAGWENKFHCEWNEFGQKILKYYWPEAESYGDITKTDFTIWRGRIDVLSGGFPCQPYSVAGKRLGKEDERHLWPEMLRAIREIQPRWVVGENVRGLTNWNGGLVFNEVQTDLEAEGYEVLPFLLPACGVNAPHRRDRVWFIAYSCRNGGQENPKRGPEENSENKQQFKRLHNNWTTSDAEKFRYERSGNARNRWNGFTNSSFTSDAPSKGSKKREQNRRWENTAEIKARMESESERHGDIETATYTSSERFEEQPGDTFTSNKRQYRRLFETAGFESFPTQSPICGGNDGVSRELDGIAFPKWRNESIKAYGNAIVPQVALQIFKAINQYQEIINNK